MTGPEVPRGDSASGGPRPFRRRLTLHRPTPTTVEAELEDHIHHVVVSLAHDDTRVLSIDGRGVRLPWSSCPGAVGALRELVGSAIGSRPVVGDMGAHCTHLLDCASSAVRFAGTDASSRRYTLSVTEAGDEDDRHGVIVTAVARSDDGRELELRTDGTTILEPTVHHGRSLRAGFSRWATDELDPEDAEMAILLRRAIWMRLSIAIDLDQLDVLSQSGVPRSSCYASQPERIHVATRNRGTSLHELPAE